MLFSLLYEFFLLLVFLATLPRALYEAIRYKKHTSNFFKRLGFGFPEIKRNEGAPVIWVHAVSVGECHAANPIVKRLRSELPRATIIVSSVSETGHAEAKKTITQADYHVYLPYDFYLPVTHVLDKARPDLVVLTEGDFWYRFLHTAKRQGAVISVINGKMSAESCRRFSRFSYFAKKLFAQIDFFCVQSDLYKERFLQAGVAASKISVTGNLKCDSLPEPIGEEEVDQLKSKLQITDGDTVVVIGSTHDPEEELLLNQLTPLLQKFSQLKLIIAPRHPERFNDVAALLEKHGVSYARWSQASCQTNPQAVLIDAMGVLRKCYQVADIAIVAGSFTEKVGGHNIMEAQVFGIPVLSGPYMHSQPQLIESAKFYNAILQVEPNAVGQAVERLLTQPSECQTLGKCALTMVEAMRGATNRTQDQLYQLAPQFFACRKVGEGVL